MFTFKKNKETFDDAMLNNAVDLVADDKKSVQQAEKSNRN